MLQTDVRQPVSTFTCVIEELTYVPLGNYKPVPVRPYVPVLNDQNVMGNIADRALANSSAKLSPSIISDVTHSIVDVSAVPMNSIVNNEWVSNPKFAFIMKVGISNSATGEMTKSYIFGFTNYNGITYDQAGNAIADPQMIHTVTSVIETYVTVANTPMGVYHTEKFKKQYNVTGAVQDTFYSIQRPVDIFDSILNKSVTDIITEYSDFPMHSYNVNHAVNPMTDRAVCNNLGNNVGSNYLTHIINGGLNYYSEAGNFIDGVTFDSGATGFMDNAAREASIRDNYFLQTINKLRDMTSRANEFTFSVLTKIDDSIADRFVVVNPGSNISNPLLAATPEVGDHWEGRDPVTVRAYSIMESTLAQALKFGFTKINMSVSNMVTPDSEPQVIVTYFNSFLNLENTQLLQLLELFKSRYITDVFMSETNGNTVPVTYDVYVDIMGASKIRLEYAGYPENWYTLPTVASSYLSPVITLDDNTRDMFVEQMKNGIQEIHDAIDTKKFM